MSRNPDNVLLRVHPITREKINAYKREKPAASIQGVLDEAVNLLLEKEQIEFHPDKQSRRSRN